MRQVGPWVLGETIGLGSGGVVRSAIHAKDGRRAVVKTITEKRSDLLGPLRREISALSELAHPGIVRIIDHGVDGVIPWYAMVRVDGIVLSHWFERHPVHQYSQERLSICSQLAQTLAYLHGIGFVHGDIKPGNVLVTGQGYPVLVDFGLASRFRSRGERASLATVEAQGTPEYMAPERIRGWGADSRSDLYAYGCLLFEAVVGIPPFTGSANEVLQAQLWRKIPWAAGIRPSVPVSVAVLIDVLTQKSLRDRRRTALQVVEELKQLLPESTCFPGDVLEPCLHSPMLRGREFELQQLKAGLAAARSRSESTLILLRGPSGAGKTFLAAEFCRALPDDLHPILFTCSEHPHERRDYAAFLAVLETILDACAERGPHFTRIILGPHAAVLGLLDRRILELPGCEGLRLPEIGSEEGLNLEVMQSIESVLVEWVRRAPCLLVVDDAQWLDTRSRDLLMRIRKSAAMPGLHVLLIETTECEKDFGPDPPFGDTSIVLPPLEQAELVEIAKDLLGTDAAPPDELMSLMRENAQGSPLYAAEIIRAAVAQRLIVSIDGQWRAVEERTAFDEIGASENVKRVIRGRMARLEPRLQELLESISILGQWADYVRTEGLLARPGPEFLPDVTRLIATGLVREMANGRLGMAHHHYLRAVLDSLDAGRRRSLHERAAEVLLQGNAAPPADLLLAVAEHRRESGNVGLERAMRRSAGIELFRGGRYRECTVQLGRALEIPAEPVDAEELAELYAVLAQALSAIGENAESVRAAIAGVEQVGIRLPERYANLFILWRVVRRVCSGWARIGGMSERAAGSAITCLWVLSQELFFQDNLAMALSVNLLTLDIGDSNPRVSVPIRTYSAVAAFAGIVGLRRTATKYERLGREQAREASNREAAGFWMSVSLMHGIRGEWRDALDTARYAERLHESVLDPRQLEIIKVLQGHALYFQGDLDGSRDAFLEVGLMGREHENEQVIAWSEFSIARCHCARGEYEGAARLLLRAESRLTALSEAQSWIITLGLLAQCFLRLGRPGKAMRYARRCLPYLYKAAPSGYPSLEGFGGVLEVLLSRPGLRPHARRVLNRFAGFARLIPSARPRYLYYRSRYLEGRSRAASARALRRAAELAGLMGMPIELKMCRGGRSAAARGAQVGVAEVRLSGNREEGRQNDG